MRQQWKEERSAKKKAVQETKAQRRISAGLQVCVCVCVCVCMCVCVCVCVRIKTGTKSQRLLMHVCVLSDTQAAEERARASQAKRELFVSIIASPSGLTGDAPTVTKRHISVHQGL